MERYTDGQYLIGWRGLLFFTLWMEKSQQLLLWTERKEAQGKEEMDERVG